MGGGSDERPPFNGRFVTRYEWDEHQRWSRDALKKLEDVQRQQAGDIDKLQRQWDRYAGPVVALLVVMGALATMASIASTVVVLGRSV